MIILPLAINKWNNELSNVLVDDLCVYDVFNFCFRTTNGSSVNWLQYRILHIILPVKYYLKKININSSDSCTFCNENSKTKQHDFVLRACLREKHAKSSRCKVLLLA